VNQDLILVGIQDQKAEADELEFFARRRKMVATKRFHDALANGAVRLTWWVVVKQRHTTQRIRYAERFSFKSLLLFRGGIDDDDDNDFVHHVW
jgi:hypothetical protein